MSEKIYQYYYIYKTTNLINEKYYYGMHCTDNLNDGYMGSGTKLKRSIKRHGKENFKTEILEFLPNKEELIKREKEIINEEVLKDPNSMNLQPGGGGGLSGEEHKKKFASAGGNATKHLLEGYREIHILKMKTDLEYREKFLDKMRGNTNWLGKTHKVSHVQILVDLSDPTTEQELVNASRLNLITENLAKFDFERIRAREESRVQNDEPRFAFYFSSGPPSEWVNVNLARSSNIVEKLMVSGIHLCHYPRNYDFTKRKEKA